MRHTRSHTKNRRSHHALDGERVSVSKDSNTVHPRHKALLDGTPYRGRSVMDKTARTKKGHVEKTEAKADAKVIKKTKDDVKAEKDTTIDEQKKT